MPDFFEQTEVRQMQCENCEGEGKVECWTGARFMDGDYVTVTDVCRCCNGDGWVVVEVRPITIEDLDDEQT